MKIMTMNIPSDPREMRKEINAAALASTYSAHLVYAADTAAYHHGWSGEDRMTAIAYMALKALEELTELSIQQQRNATIQDLFVKNPVPS